MEIDITENRIIKLTKVFNPVLFETKEGEKLYVSMRDGGFEIGCKDMGVKNPPGTTEEYYRNYRVMGGVIEELFATVKDPELPPCGVVGCDCGYNS